MGDGPMSEPRLVFVVQGWFGGGKDSRGHMISRWLDWSDYTRAHTPENTFNSQEAAVHQANELHRVHNIPTRVIARVHDAVVWNSGMV
jgi:hypothetical protein